MDPHTRQRRQAPESDSDTYSNEGCEVEEEGPSVVPRHQFQMQDSSSSNIMSGGEERDLAVEEEEEEKETHGGHRRRKQQRSDFVPASVALTHTTRQRVDFPKADSTCLEALLRHYPWIVYFVFSAWRKMLILCHIDQNGDDENLPLIAQLALVGDLPNGIESALPRALYLHRERYSPIKYSALSIGFGLFFDVCRRNNQKDCLAWLHEELPIERDWDTWTFNATAVVPELTALTSFLLVQQLALETDRDDRAQVAKQLSILLTFGSSTVRHLTRPERHHSIHADAGDVARLFHLEKEPSVLLHYAVFFCHFGNAQGMSSFFTLHPEVILQLLKLYQAEPLNQDSFLKCSAWAGMALSNIIESYKNDNNLQDLFPGAPSSSSSPSPEFPIHEIIEQCLDRLKTGVVVVNLVMPSLRLLITFFSIPHPVGAEDKDASPRTPTESTTLGDKILDSAGPFPEISDLLRNGNIYIVESTCELLALIAGGSDRHRQWLVKSGHLPRVPMLDAANGLGVLANPNPDVSKQLLTLFSRVADNASTDQFDYLIQTCQFLTPFVAALPVADPHFVLMILDSLKKILQRSSELWNGAAWLTGEANAIPVLKDLRGIAEASELLRLLDAGEDEDGDEESMFFAVE